MAPENYSNNGIYDKSANSRSSGLYFRQFFERIKNKDLTSRFEDDKFFIG